MSATLLALLAPVVGNVWLVKLAHFTLQPMANTNHKFPAMGGTHLESQEGEGEPPPLMISGEPGNEAISLSVYSCFLVCAGISC